jgi:hypothetical protein
VFALGAQEEFIEFSETEVTATGRVSRTYIPTHAAAGLPQHVRVEREHDLAGRRSRTLLPSGLVEFRGYDASGRLTVVAGAGRGGP